jgi:hypothetical protein
MFLKKKDQLSSVGLGIAAVAIGFFGNPISAQAVGITNLSFTVTPTSGPHGFTATANVSFNFMRFAIFPSDALPISYQVELWESDFGPDEFIGIFGGTSPIPGIEDGSDQVVPVTANPFSFVPHNTGGMHTFTEGDTIEVYAYIRDTGTSGTNAGFTDISSNPVDVTDVPEPLTILGSGIALGFGALFKKEYSRKQKKVKSLEKQKA